VWSSTIELEFRNVDCFGGKKIGDPEKNPQSKGENQQQAQLTYNTESGDQTRVTVLEASAFTATPPRFLWTWLNKLCKVVLTLCN
jgi:hypothetical protein